MPPSSPTTARTSFPRGWSLIPALIGLSCLVERQDRFANRSDHAGVDQARKLVQLCAARFYDEEQSCRRATGHPLRRWLPDDGDEQPVPPQDGPGPLRNRAAGGCGSPSWFSSCPGLPRWRVRRSQISRSFRILSAATASLERQSLDTCYCTRTGAACGKGREAHAIPRSGRLKSLSPGFTIVLAGLKALLEHGIELNLVRDQFPDAAKRVNG